MNEIIVEGIMNSTLSISSFAQTGTTNDPAVIGAYGAAVTAILTAIFTGLNLSGRLKEERSKREQLEVNLETERGKRSECMVEVAQLRGRVASLETMLRSRGFL